MNAVKTIMASIAVLCASASISADKASARRERPQPTPEQRQALKAEFRRETGGFVVKPDPGNGRVVVANAQSRVPAKCIKQSVGYLRFHGKLSAAVTDVQAGAVLPVGPETAKRLGGTLAVVVTDDPSSPETITVSPDGRWATVNVAPLSAGADGEVLGARAGKAVMRAICFLCGAGSSQHPNTLVGPLRDPVRDYDRFPVAGVPPDVFPRMLHYIGALGIRPVVQATYKKACREGWAPAPTNDVQKAIWDKVHTPPKTPITIEYDPKKGK